MMITVLVSTTNTLSKDGYQGNWGGQHHDADDVDRDTITVLVSTINSLYW